MSTVQLVAVALTVFPSLTKGQIGQLLHFVIPGMILLGLFWGVVGTFERIILSLMFWGLLYATRGGRGKTSFKWGSFSIIVLQCFFIIFGRAGSLGSYKTAKIGLFIFSSGLMVTFSRAFFLGISFAFVMAELIMCFLSFLSSNNCLSSSNLLSRVSGSEQILIILYAREKGILLVTWAG